MAGESKKISFGFSKINKKPQIAFSNKLKEKPEPIVNKVEFIECLEGKSIKVINGEDVKKELPVIPMRVASTLRESILETINSRNNKSNAQQKNDENNGEKKETTEENKTLTLDELAAKEIMEDLKKKNENETNVDSTRQVPLANQNAISEKEPTLDDYETMPITDFGLAMLRGMGWEEKKGIGLNEKVVQPVTPALRPKGMGLGADKVLQVANQGSSKNPDLIMKKGAAVKVISGPHVNAYGKIEGFDELPGRIVVKLTLSDISLSVNECMVQLVPTEEYNKYSKVLNLDKFHEYKKNESENKITEKKKESSSKNRNNEKYEGEKKYSRSSINRENERGKIKHTKLVKSYKSYNRYEANSSGSNSPEERPSRSRRSSENSNEDKAQASKKHGRYKSPEPSYKKKSKPNKYDSDNSDSPEDERKKSTQRKSKYKRDSEEDYNRKKHRDTATSEDSRRRKKKERSDSEDERRKRKEDKYHKHKSEHKKHKRRHRSRS